MHFAQRHLIRQISSLTILFYSFEKKVMSVRSLSLFMGIRHRACSCMSKSSGLRVGRVHKQLHFACISLCVCNRGVCVLLHPKGTWAPEQSMYMRKGEAKSYLIKAQEIWTANWRNRRTKEMKGNKHTYFLLCSENGVQCLLAHCQSTFQEKRKLTYQGKINQRWNATKLLDWQRHCRWPWKDLL